MLTQRHSSTLNGCSGAVHTHQSSGDANYSLKGIHVHSIAFRGCSHSLKGVHIPSIAFRGCLILTQICSFSWSHHSESCSILTQWHSCSLNGCLHSLNGIHEHSNVFRGCSHSLTDIHAHSILHTVTLRHCHVHSIAFRGCSKLTQRHSASSYT